MSKNRREQPRMSQRQRIFRKMKQLAKNIETLAWALKNQSIVAKAGDLLDTIKFEFS